MSKFFDRTRETGGSAEEIGVERWLQSVQEVVGDQLATVSVPFNTASVEPEAIAEKPKSSARSSEAPAPARAKESLKAENAKSEFRRVILPRDLEKLLIFEDESNRIAGEAYRTLRTRLVKRQNASGIRSMVITSAVPGDGKTLTTINLGLCCAQLPSARVLVIDGDLRTAGLTSLLGLPSSPGLAEILEGKIEAEKAVLNTNIENFYVLSAGSHSTAPPELFANKSWREFLDWAKESFRMVFIDSPPILGIADFEIISAAADGVIAVVRARVTDQEVFKQTLGHIDNTKLIGVVFNGTDQMVNSRYSYLYYRSKVDHRGRGK